MARPSLRRLALAAIFFAACVPTVGAPVASPPLTAQALRSGTLPPPPSPMATSSGTTTIVAGEREAWAQIRALLPQGAPVAAPTWLPSMLDREHAVALRRTDGYLVTYSGAGRSIEFGMGGTAPPDGQSGLGTRVRRSPAVLSFASILFTDPSAPETRVIKWKEAGRDLWISSSSLPGGDVLRVAWELDEATAPRPTYVRVKDGACASTTRPDATVARLMELIGSRDADAVLDCFALDVGFANWATLPTTTDRMVRSAGEVGGRVETQATWRFTSEPAFWTQGSIGNQFFQLGMEGGRWRVFAAGTAAFGSPP